LTGTRGNESAADGGREMGRLLRIELGVSESVGGKEQGRKPGRGTMNQSRIQMGSVSQAEEAGGAEDFLNVSLNHQ